MNRRSCLTAPFALIFALLASALPVAGQAAGPLGSPVPTPPLGEALEEAGSLPAVSFAAHQLAFDRVAGARDSADGQLSAAFAEAGVAYPARELFLRVFKHERQLEVWARSHAKAPFTLVRSYPVCSLPGQLGPKRRMGDLQVPEGFYYIDEFNPRSEFHLSLRVNYPNTSDRLRRGALSLGGDIFIHGGCSTVGCVPIEDRNIQELYWLAVQATDAGQRLIPVHIFPARLDPGNLRWLKDTFAPEPDLLAFWKNLARGYAFFEETRRVPWVTVAQNGHYTVPDPSDPAGEAGEDRIGTDSVADAAPAPVSGGTSEATGTGGPGGPATTPPGGGGP